MTERDEILARERDVRLYGVTVARWLRAQKNLGLSVPVLADKAPSNHKSSGNSLEAQDSTTAEKSKRNPAADKPLTKPTKDLNSYL